jgi:choline dehydrogenase-like flavoprotein
MTVASDHYDVVIIGSGTGGGTFAWKLAPPTPP